jgi:Holliday junction resolvasome RuvABC endonuclease subunit
VTRVVGVDLSLTGTGIAIAVVGGSNPVCTADLIGQKGITALPLPERWRAMGDLCDELLDAVVQAPGAPGLVAIENLPAARVAGVILHEKSWLWWMLVGRLVMLDIPLVEVTPAAVKQYAAGKGNANKGAVIDAVARRLPMFATGGDDNRADAAVLCAIAADLIGHPLTEMPALHRKALAKLRLADPRRPL